MSKILIVYGTAYGQTERIMQRIGQKLTGAGHTVTLHRGDQLPPRLPIHGFDGFLVAASILSGRHQRYIKGFARRHGHLLSTAPSAFVSISGSAASADPKVQDQAQQCITTFLKETGWQPRVTRTFGGAIAYTRYNWVLRIVMRWISRRSGGPTDTSRDHELTDWNAVDRFAHELATSVFVATGAPTSASKP